MTAVVADSATIVWWLSDDARLSLAAVKALQAADVGDGIFISAVTLVDIWYATRKRRGALAAEQLAELDHTIRDPDVNVHVLPLQVRQVATPGLGADAAKPCPIHSIASLWRQHATEASHSSPPTESSEDWSSTQPSGEHPLGNTPREDHGV